MLAGFARIREQLDIPASFPAEVETAVDAVVATGPTIPAGSPTAVRDALDIPFAAIDPPGSLDLDQAFAAEERPGGHRVFYAIADVASLVPPGGPIDIEARQRGVTLYSPDRRTSLHPERINEDIGSLLAGEERQALLWTIDLDAGGEIVDATLERALVRNRAQLTYREAQDQILSGRADASLALLRTIGEQRQALERERGAVSLALPAQEVVTADDGSFELEYDESLVVEEWNAQISLLTGIAASRIMIDAGVGLLRTLPEPDQRTVGQIRRTARALGVEWADGVGYAERVRELRPDTPTTAALLSQAARGLRGAGYVAFTNHDLPEDPQHSAIASTYAHVTAPLRRLCDRFANEIIVAVCADAAPPAWAVEALDELPKLMGGASQRDRTLERAVVDYVEAMVLTRRVGDTFHAVVTDVDDRGRGRVQLRDPAVVARVAGDGLALGSEVVVRLDEADPDQRLVRFSVVSG
ncbi:MAG: ribonuclease R [Acidimicrobiales bacterium]|nr:MAG: ribonuclease R [Acidimicrobiales bacterium]